MSESVHVAINVYINWHFYIYFVIIKMSIPVKQLTTLIVQFLPGTSLKLFSCSWLAFISYDNITRINS